MSEQPPSRAQVGGEPIATPDPPPRRAIWRIPRGILARYVRFTGRHRFMGCLGCLGGLLFLVMLCGATVQAANILLGDRDALAPLLDSDVNEIGTLIDAEEESVEEYLTGMAEFDANRMWGAHAESARTAMAARGGSPEQLQRGLAEAQSRGAKIESAYAIGSYPLRDGRRYVFYIVRRSGFPPDGGPEELYFIFTVDPAGRILNVT